jgi:hypothetical protein
MTAQSYTEDQLVEPPAIGPRSQRVPFCEGRLHHSPLSPTGGWTFWASATRNVREERHD